MKLRFDLKKSQGVVKRFCFITVGLIQIFCINAFSRTSEGFLDLLRLPNNGVPAIVAQGESFDVELASQAVLRLVGEGAPLELTTEWAPQTDGVARGRCAIPADAPAGVYALEAVSGDKIDRNEHAVFVRESFPESYVVAHIADIAIGSEDAKRNPVETLAELIRNLNGEDVAFAIITGDITRAGEDGQYRDFLKAIESASFPIFTSPGARDAKTDAYDRFFGSCCYMFRFGKDGYISFDTKDVSPVGDLEAQCGEVEKYRRAIKASRWSIGFTHRYDPAMGAYAQVALFVDDPLDLLILSRMPGTEENAEGVVPWQTTPLVSAPSAKDGFARLFDVSAKGPAPRPPRRIVSME